jgi:hypothetical protein
VRMTSSPSSSPVMRVSPEARPPNMNERCEIDLSPGTRAVPESADDLRAVAGFGAAVCDMGFSLDQTPAAGLFLSVWAVSYHGGPKWSSPCKRSLNTGIYDIGFRL